MDNVDQFRPRRAVQLGDGKNTDPQFKVLDVSIGEGARACAYLCPYLVRSVCVCLWCALPMCVPVA